MESNYGSSLAETPASVREERAQAVKSVGIANGLSSAGVERVTYGEHTREIGVINHEAIGRPVNKRYERHLKSVQTRNQSIGVLTATVVNFLPIRLVSDSVLDPLRRAKIAAPKEHQPYTTFIFDEVFYEPSVISPDAPPIAVDQHPIILAQEFSKINSSGVFSFIGIPEDLEREDWKRKKSPEEQHGGRTYGEALDACRQSAIEWMHREMDGGEDNSRLNRAWTFPQKAAARRLLALGLIKTLPTGVEEVKDVQRQVPICPQCMRRSEPGASQCTNQGCGYIIDPRRAYELGGISEEHPALERLTRGEVQKMGISQYIAETIDEKAERLKIGGMKPMSEVTQRMMEAEDEAKQQTL